MAQEPLLGMEILRASTPEGDSVAVTVSLPVWLALNPIWPALNPKMNASVH